MFMAVHGAILQLCSHPVVLLRNGAMANKATEYAELLRRLARFSQCSETRSAYMKAAEVIDRIAAENQELRERLDSQIAAAAL